MAVSAKEILAEAEALRETMISDRRTLHAAPEAGADLPRTREYVAGRLREMGYEPKELAGGITAEITGSDTGTCILLRADMDALCVTEQTDLPFRSQNGCMHACGHDMHTAMLLGAAKLLRGYQSKLNGTVKLYRCEGNACGRCAARARASGRFRSACPFRHAVRPRAVR